MKMSKSSLHFNVLLRTVLSLAKTKKVELFKKYIETESWQKFTSLSKPRKTKKLKIPCVNLKTLKMITPKRMKR